MTIAEKRANEYYPKLNEQDDVAAWHGFIAGYEQAKKDMMKDAVEGSVNQDGILELSNGEAIDVCPSLDKCALGLHIGDKVRIVVLKEEE